MLNIIFKLAIFSVIAIIILYLALSKNRFIPKSIRISAQFLLLPLHPYLKHGDTLKGIGGTIAISCGVGLVLSLIFGLIKHFMK
ncbi:MAG: hypothetical protein COV71_05855 [Candidatus Omnitrophica bacterium CG11_big_fil_rev_8_21_14_0_20_41_12]|nr:MAG: hypothetical protein COV71_05855 [Candidatus Omnitrophica bacterium CG11_big_fil_rev_8_21_14_0_20_41_12]